MRRLSLMLMVAILGTSLPSFAQAIKIGFVDLQAALAQTTEGKAIKAKLERLLQQKQKDFDKMQEEVKRLKDELESQGAMMREDLRNKKLQEYQRKMVELQEFYMNNQKELQEEEARLVKPLMDRFEKVLAQLGKDEGFTVIFPAATILWGQPALDLTQRLVQMINAGAGK
ncbi:MAG TPA: OmpH family outer membrane protein [Myxococcota bacterium]|nr:OmpH family outer membrane protein [Myxococcota bacterium]HQK50317.1 OmpH family outer membrane protein [Myxococcota bacterium]